MALKLKADTEEAKTNTAKRSKKKFKYSKSQICISRSNCKTKAEYERKAEERKARFLDRQKVKRTGSIIRIRF